MEHNLSNRDELLGCIIGLSRVCSMHQKSDRTDLLILQGLIDSSDMNLSDGTIQNTTFLIKSEKSKIAPTCGTGFDISQLSLVLNETVSSFV